ncbi:hypothetical protein ANRL4_03645 [Anaerolineae bacterium]|nr:hypothetical protein ANRL4_03645 [Anaerolineae bacterium]
MYLRARYYVPQLGAFPSLDPVEEGNRYGYVGGNVVNRVDPSGMQATYDQGCEFLYDVFNRYSNFFEYLAGVRTQYVGIPIHWTDALLFLNLAFDKCKCSPDYYSDFRRRMFLEFDVRLFFNGLSNAYSSSLATYNPFHFQSPFLNSLQWGSPENSYVRSFMRNNWGNSACQQLECLFSQAPSTILHELENSAIPFFRKCFPVLYDELLSQPPRCDTSKRSDRFLSPRDICYLTNLRSLLLDTISVVPGTRIGSAAGIAAVSASIYDLANSNSPTSYDPYALAGAIYAGVATFVLTPLNWTEG